MAMLMSAAVMAAPAEGASDGVISLNLASFAGIVAAVSALVTQVFKAIPAIKETTLAKIGVSVACGVVLCLGAWALQASPALAGYDWWQVALYGLCAGLSGCGFYDVIKAIGALIQIKK